MEPIIFQAWGAQQPPACQAGSVVCSLDRVISCHFAQVYTTNDNLFDS
jgi:hypothetical protein